MSVTAPETALRTALRTALNAAFDGKGEHPGPFTFRDDRLHESLGWKLSEGSAVGGCYPEVSRENLRDGQVLESTIRVQLYGYWKREVDPEQEVSPATVETWAETLRRAVQSASYTASNHLWYFRVTAVDFPKDPTGNMTRLEATVLAFSDNAGLVETTG